MKNKLKIYLALGIFAIIAVAFFTVYAVIINFNQNNKPLQIKTQSDSSINKTGKNLSENIKTNEVENNSKYIILFGDTGNAKQSQYDVANSVSARCKEVDCQNIVILGDVIYENGVSNVDDSQFKTKFEDVYKDINQPINIVFGNHDYRDCVQCYIDYSSKSDKWKMPDRYYKLETENILMLVIDTEKFDPAQQDWLKQQLQQNADKLSVVLGHKPIYTNENEHYGENWTGKEDLRKIICNSAQAYISGHAHILEDVGNLEGCKVKQLISGGGGADLRRFIDNPKQKFGAVSWGYLQLLDSKEGKYTFYNQKGEILFENQLVK
jgi:tartrate-resistant acid phosphatase type 5